jgi:hypothetical protein
LIRKFHLRTPPCPPLPPHMGGAVTVIAPEVSLTMKSRRRRRRKGRGGSEFIDPSAWSNI